MYPHIINTARVLFILTANTVCVCITTGVYMLPCNI